MAGISNHRFQMTLVDVGPLATRTDPFRLAFNLPSMDRSDEVFNEALTLWPFPNSTRFKAEPAEAAVRLVANDSVKNGLAPTTRFTNYKVNAVVLSSCLRFVWFEDANSLCPRIARTLNRTDDDESSGRQLVDWSSRICLGQFVEEELLR